MFSNSHKFVYVHPQKTGGNTISEYLFPHTEHVRYTRGQLLKGGFSLGQSQGIGKHAGIEPYKQLGFHLRMEEWTVFGSIRYPLDRLLSWWYYEKSVKTGEANGPTNFYSLTAFAKKWYKGYSYKNMFHDEAGELIVRDVVRLERIADDLPPLLAKIGIEIKGEEIPRINGNSKRPIETEGEVMADLDAWMRERFPFDFSYYEESPLERLRNWGYQKRLL